MDILEGDEVFFFKQNKYPSQCRLIVYMSCLVLSLSALVFSRAGYASWGLSFSSVWYYLHLVFSACMAAVKSRPVPHHCEVIFFWSLGIMKCTCMVFTFENGVPLMRKGASVVWHHSLLLMNSFNKTEAAVFSCRLCFLRAFLFISLLLVPIDIWSNIEKGT